MLLEILSESEEAFVPETANKPFLMSYWPRLILSLFFNQ